MARAKAFQHETETELNEKLAPLATDGVILGERKCFLINGMGQQLAQNFIYRDRLNNEKWSLQNKNDSEYSGSNASSMR